jgi:hypothetical protein
MILGGTRCPQRVGYCGLSPDFRFVRGKRLLRLRRWNIVFGEADPPCSDAFLSGVGA